MLAFLFVHWDVTRDPSKFPPKPLWHHDCDNTSSVSWCMRMAAQLYGIPYPGMQDIKWIELYDKWRPLVPEQHRKGFKFFEEDPGPERRAKVKSHTKEAKKQRKERSVTSK